MPNLQLGRESSEKYPGAYAEGDVCCPMEVTGSHCMHVTALYGGSALCHFYSLAVL